MSDNANIDDEMQDITVCMIRTRMPINPPSYGSINSLKSEDSQDIIQVRAHFEYCETSYFNGKIYAISDEGEDL